MKKLLFALLTTLLVNAMPLQAAYAVADDANGEANKQTQQDCISYLTILSDENREILKTQNGTIVELEGVRAKAFQSRVEEAVGSKAPFEADLIVIVNPNGEDDTLLNIVYFSNNCLKAFMHLPSQLVEMLLSPLEKKPGERVD